jgi:hypothetical protein
MRKKKEVKKEEGRSKRENKKRNTLHAVYEVK